jgi:DNA primase
MVEGQEFHSILQNIFGDVQGINQSSQLQVNCPMCAEREGLSEPDGKFNLEINTKKRLFRCWKCENPSFSGSLGRLIKIFGNDADYQMYKSYAGSFNDYDYEEDEKEYVAVKLPEEMILFSQMEAGNLEHFEAYNYMVNDRKISREIILKYRLGFCTTGKYEKRIIIPSYDANGEVNYFVGRTYDPKMEKKKKYDNPKSDKDRIIFNEGLVNWDSTVYLVEGAFEMLSFPVNIIPMLGKTISTTLYLKLKEMKPDVVVLLDPDAYKSSIDLYYKLHTLYVDCEERVRIVKLPTMDDLDNLRKKFGIDEVIKSLRGARGLTVDDYFVNKLQKPYDRKGYGRHDFNSKHLEWKSSGGGNIF